MQTRTLAFAAPWLCLLVACASAAPVPAPAPTPAAVVTAEPAPPAASASAVVAPPPKADETPWVAVGAIPTDAVLFPVEGAMFVASNARLSLDEGKPTERSGYRIAVLRDGKLEEPPYLFLSEGWFQRVVSIQGRWPDAIDMAAGSDTGRIGYYEHFVMSAKGWEIRAGKCKEQTVGGMTVPGCPTAGSWIVGMHQVGLSVVAQAAQVMFGQPSFVTLRGPSLPARMTAAPSSCARSDPSSPRFLVHPSHFGGMKDGTLISIGRACTGGLVAEVWKPGQATSQVMKLSADSTVADGGAVLAGRRDDAWALTGDVRHFDGTAWRSIAPPAPKASFKSGAVGVDGTLWAIDGDGAVWTLANDAWTRAQLPVDAKAESVAVTDDGDVWMAANGVLFRHARAGEATGAAPSIPMVAAKDRPKSRRPVTPGSTRCPQNVVVLFGFTKVTPDDYDFPLTRKAIKGHTELADVKFVVTRDAGRKFFAALTPTYDVAKKVVAAVEKGVQGSKPQVVCADPEVVRELQIDLRTGDVKR